MNVKGLKLNKKLALLLNESIDNISKNNLLGLEMFNSFSWSGFSKDEFKNLLNLFSYLNNQNLFDNISNKQTIVFNYSTDVTELDIVTIMMSNGKPILIDIESKNGDDSKLNEKIINQINQRKNEQIPELMKKNAFLTIGFINNNYVKGYYFDGISNKEIENFDDLLNLFKKFEEYENVEEYLLQSSNLASISKVCKEIENGNYKFYAETNNLYNQLINKMEKEDVAIVYGHAGTGKSVLALKLFFENHNSKLLMMNSKFYYSLNFNKKYYSEERATFNSNYFLKFIDKESISIIDECQRLPYDYLVKVIENSKMTYLFGDNRQVFNEDGCILSALDLKRKFIKDGFVCSYKTLKKSRRYSDEVSDALEILSGRKKVSKDIKLPIDYQINLFYDEKDFIESYYKTEGLNKIYVPINQAIDDITKIDGITFVKADKTDDDFSNWINSKNYYGTTYHALSFDIDHCFVYLKNICLVNQNKEQMLFYKKEFKDVEIILFLNELNVLFTKGKKSLNIYVGDIEVYLFLNKLLHQIK